jgi:RNA polymerase sigma factor (sigma-70 family)
MKKSVAEETKYLLRTASGEHLAFERLYKLCSPRLFSSALRLLRDRALAEDALQDAFLKIWRNAKQYDAQKGTAMAWMSMILRRACLDRLASRKPTEPIDDLEIASPIVEPSDPAVRKCLEFLLELPRRALVLAYAHGYTHDEIAEILVKPVGTVKSWVRRSGIALKECLEA